ncbi:unnamed protein product [marine sediment metagenome]|uniref:Uncharacterized protein n=1 Tax=marine sediment metagenome TaxID=412755 RepID=X1UD35_9ZZZZ
MTEELDDIEGLERSKERECPFNHTRMCPHGFTQYPYWCTVCVLAEILREIKLIGARQN